MKTKKLVELLQKADPSGEIEVCVDNLDILDVQRMEAYWDGRLQVLNRNEDDRIINGSYVASGNKVVISPMSIQEYMGCYAELEVDYSQLWPEDAEEYKKSDEAWREKVKATREKCERSLFNRWVCKRVGDAVEDEVTDKFYAEFNLNRNDPIMVELGWSYQNTRYTQWDKIFDIIPNCDEALKITKK